MIKTGLKTKRQILSDKSNSACNIQTLEEFFTKVSVTTSFSHLNLTNKLNCC